jgi:dienelactone hydrolase
MRKWLPAILIGLGFAASVAAFGQLTPRVRFPAELLLPPRLGGAAETVPRLIAAFGLPTLALALWALLFEAPAGAFGRLGARLFPGSRPARYEIFAPSYRLIVIWVVCLPLSMHFVVLGNAVGWPIGGGRVVGMTLGGGLMLAGNLFPRLRPNPIAGIRTARTMSDPRLWARVHRTFGALWLLAGALTALVAIVSPAYALAAAVATLALSALGGVFLLRSMAAAVTALLLIAGSASAQMEAPGSSPAAISPADTTAPAFAREEELDIQGDGVTLPATLTLPASASGPVPVALIVAGSGPTDRNGNVLGTPYRPFLYAQLAWGLAGEGIASLRYDKRGAGARAENTDPTTLTTEVFRDDVTTIARFLRADPRFSRLIAIGHSEGAGLVVQAANDGAPVDGVIMMSGAGRPLKTLLHDQLSMTLDSDAVIAADSIVAAYLDGREIRDVPEYLRPLVMPQYLPMMRSLAAYDPPAEVRQVAVPLLLVHGGMDLQTTERDFSQLVAARPDAERLIIPTANHVFKASTSRTPAGQLEQYFDSRLPIVPELVPGVAAWVRTISPAD